MDAEMQAVVDGLADVARRAIGTGVALTLAVKEFTDASDNDPTNTDRNRRAFLELRRAVIAHGEVFDDAIERGDELADQMGVERYAGPR